MERRRSLPRKQFPHSKAKTASADAADDREFPVADTGGRGALCEDEEDDEEKRMKFSSPSKTVIGGSYSPGWPAKRTVLAAAGGSGSHPCCVVEKCTADLSEAKRYYRRHKVCEAHSKAPVVIIAGLRQRFCQQCSRFHELSEFDEAKRSCRRRLVGHNERRRKSSSEPQREGSNHFRPAD